MTDQVRIRVASLEDLSTVLRHRRGMFFDMGHRDPVALAAMEKASRPFFERAMREGHYHGFLAVSEAGEVRAGGGIVLLEYQPHPEDPRPRRPFIVNMYTEPEHRRRGLGRRLLETMLAWCRQEEYRVVFLHASDEGRPLYEGLGFRATNEMRLRP